MATVIHGYYSDLDYRDNDFSDGVYVINHAPEYDLKAEIKKAWEEIGEDDEWNWSSSLRQVLEYLIQVKGAKITYYTLEVNEFDLDYGVFDKEGK